MLGEGRQEYYRALPAPSYADLIDLSLAYRRIEAAENDKAARDIHAVEPNS